MEKTGKIAVLAGDGIGPEVMEEALQVLKALEDKFEISFDLEPALIGGAAYDGTGHPFPVVTKKICDESDAILFGCVGSPKWDYLPPELTPEIGALLPIRKRYKLAINLRPIVVYPGLEERSPLKTSLVRGVDFLVVRELVSGIYFGRKKLEDLRALDVMEYKFGEVYRVASVAFRLAQERKGRLTSVDKANVLACGKLWRRVVNIIADNIKDVIVSHLYVDNAAMQLVLNPKQFDVVLCPNMFGDILSDEGASLTGSLGMIPSASINPANKFGMYEPAGGSAPDIAGKGIANPLAQILSLALMLRYTFELETSAQAIEKAVKQVIADGFRTPDIMSEGCHKVSTSEMGDEVIKRL